MFKPLPIGPLTPLGKSRNTPGTPVDPQTLRLTTGPLKIGDSITFYITTYYAKQEQWVKAPPPGPNEPVMYNSVRGWKYYGDGAMPTVEGREPGTWVRPATDAHESQDLYHVSEINGTQITLLRGSFVGVSTLGATEVSPGVIQLAGNLSKNPYYYTVSHNTGNPYPDKVLDDNSVWHALLVNDRAYLQWIFTHTSLRPRYNEVVNAAAAGDDWLFHDLWNLAKFKPDSDVVNWAAANGHWALTNFLLQHGGELTSKAPNMVVREPDENYANILQVLKDTYGVSPTLPRDRWGKLQP